MPSPGASTAPSARTPKRPGYIDPIVRNALRYTVSAKEYKLLHRYLISRAPAVRKRTPAPPQFEAIVRSGADVGGGGGGGESYNVTAVRVSLRVFASTYTALRIWEVVSARLVGGGGGVARSHTKPRTTLLKSPNFRLSSSLALILFFHRLLHRFLVRLRQSLLSESAKPFRRRNPRVARTLTSRVAPAIGASLSGLFLAVSPADQLRMTIAIYVAAKGLEFCYNYLEDEGWFRDRPWWFGSWLLMPAACGQLLHAFVFDRDCFPEAYGSLLLKRSPQYVQQRPVGYPRHRKWPEPFDIVDSLAEMSRLQWPPFISPILFPTTKTLPPSLTAISPITSPAHPAIHSLSCALLHPSDPSCLRTYISYWLSAFPPITRLLTTIYALLALPHYRTFLATPLPALAALARRVLRSAVFLTGALGSVWGSLCLFHALLPRTVLPSARWFLGGALAGCWAVLDRRGGRAAFLVPARLSVASAWRVGVKRGWWRGVRGGDVVLFVAGLAAVGGVYEVDPAAVSGRAVRKSLGMLRGEGWVDRAGSREGGGGGEKEKTS